MHNFYFQYFKIRNMANRMETSHLNKYFTYYLNKQLSKTNTREEHENCSIADIRQEFIIGDSRKRVIIE
jgi:hypothetical protein